MEYKQLLASYMPHTDVSEVIHFNEDDKFAILAAMLGEIFIKAGEIGRIQSNLNGLQD